MEEKGLADELLSVFGVPAEKRKKADFTCRRLEGLVSLLAHPHLALDRPCPHSGCMAQNQELQSKLASLQNSLSLAPNPVTDVDNFLVMLLATKGRPYSAQTKLDAFAYLVKKKLEICTEVRSAYTNRSITGALCDSLQTDLHNCEKMLDYIRSQAPYFSPHGFRQLRLSSYGC